MIQNSFIIFAKVTQKSEHRLTFMLKFALKLNTKTKSIKSKNKEIKMQRNKRLKQRTWPGARDISWIWGFWRSALVVVVVVVVVAGSSIKPCAD